MRLETTLDLPANGPSKRASRIAIVLASAAISIALCPVRATGEDAQPTRSGAGAAVAEIYQEVIGTWRGPIEHDGKRSEFALRFAPHEDALVAFVSMPALDAWDAWAVPASLADDAIVLGRGWWTLGFDGETITGTLPEALVPVYEIGFELRRVPEDEGTTALAEAANRGLGSEDSGIVPTASPLWTVDLGSPVWAGLAATDDLVLVGADDGVLRALDPASGEIRWTFETDGPIRATPTLLPVGGAAEGGGGASTGSGGETLDLLLHSDDGHLYRLAAEDGSLRWQAKLSPPEERTPEGEKGDRYHHYTAAATVEGDRVFVASGDGAVQALDAATGESLWRVEIGDVVASTPAVADGRLFVAGFDGKVHALDAATGERLWERETGAAIPGSAAVDGELVIVGSRSYDLIALRAADGSVAWKSYHFFSWVESTPVVAGDLVLVGLSDGQALVASDLVSGSERWRFDTGGSVWSRPATGDGIVAVGAVGVADYFVPHEGGLFAVDPQTGEPLWRFRPPRADAERESADRWGFGAAPTIHGGRVHAADLQGRVYAFSAGGESHDPGVD
jgi:outer membrane protein assembly factor BamB